MSNPRANNLAAKTHCVYLIRNKVNGKCYIGRTCSFETRIKGHFRGSSSNCLNLKYAIRKYGTESFDAEILHSGLTYTESCRLEVKEIAERKTKSPNGYNLTDGGDVVAGIEFTEDSRKKMSESQLKNYEENPDRREEISRRFRGVPKTEEHKAKLRGKSHPPSEKARQAVAESNRRRKMPAELKTRLAEMNSLRHKDPAFREKLGAWRKDPEKVAAWRVKASAAGKMKTKRDKFGRYIKEKETP